MLIHVNLTKPYIECDLEQWRSVKTLGALAEHHQDNGLELIWDTPDHQRATDLRIVERYTGLKGQERLGLVDPAGRVWHYDALEVSWIAQR